MYAGEKDQLRGIIDCILIHDVGHPLRSLDASVDIQATKGWTFDVHASGITKPMSQSGDRRSCDSSSRVGVRQCASLIYYRPW